MEGSKGGGRSDGDIGGRWGPEEKEADEEEAKEDTVSDSWV